jgi:hypothetical protein
VSSFERKIAIIGIGIATITAALFYVQLNEMTKQTQILASQSEGTNAGSLMDEMDTRRQLVIAQEQAVEARKQAKAAEDSVKAIQAQMRQDQRPLLKVTSDFIQKPLIVGSTVGGTVTFQNIGKTPAKNIVGKWYLRMVRNGEPLRLTYHPKNWWGITMGAIYPNEPPTTEQAYWEPDNWTGGAGRPPTNKVTPKDYDDFVHGKAFLIIYGNLAYIDGFGISHWSHFCTWTTFATANSYSGNYSAQNCTAYNAVDSNR